MHPHLTTLTAVTLALLAGCAAPTDLAAPAAPGIGHPDPPDQATSAGQAGRPSDRNGSTPTADATGAPQGDGEPVWASLDAAAIHPGIQTVTEGAQCTANFVFWAPAAAGGFDVYIGQAAHCAGTGAATDTNGCTADSLPLGTQVDLGTGNPGVLAYSSWLAMQDANTTASAPECFGNDVALVQVAEADEARVSPEVPFFGGPTGLAPTTGLALGDDAYSFGNSGLRLGFEPVLSWKHGTVVAADAWSADVYTATPGVPGDSGSGFLTADGKAFGVLSTLVFLPAPASNEVAGLASALAYMEAHGGPEVELATAPWTGGIA